MPVRDQLVIFSIGTGNVEAAWEALRAMTASVVITEPEPAADDLALRRRPLSLLSSPVLITFPEPFRPDKVERPDAQAFFGARDWPSGEDEAFIQVQAVPNPNKAEIADVVETTANALSDKLKLPEPIAFTSVNDEPAAYVSTPFSTAPDETQRIVYMVLDDSRFAMLIFRTTAPDAAVRERYMAMAENIAVAARVSAEYQAARQSATRPAEEP